MNVQMPYKRSLSGLHLLIDSTGIKFLGEGERKCKKHGVEHRRQWCKLHNDMDAKRLQIRAVCVTSNNVSDASCAARLLLQQLPEDETLESVIEVMGPTTHNQSMKQSSGEALSQSSYLERMLAYAMSVSLNSVMRRLLHAGD